MVWPTTRPPASTVGADSYGALSATTTKPRLARSVLKDVYCSRGTPKPGEKTRTGHVRCAALTGASNVAWVSNSPKAPNMNDGRPSIEPGSRPCASKYGTGRPGRCRSGTRPGR